MKESNSRSNVTFVIKGRILILLWLSLFGGSIAFADQPPGYYQMAAMGSWKYPQFTSIDDLVGRYRTGWGPAMQRVCYGVPNQYVSSCEITAKTAPHAVAFDGASTGYSTFPGTVAVVSSYTVHWVYNTLSFRGVLEATDVHNSDTDPGWQLNVYFPVCANPTGASVTVATPSADGSIRCPGATVAIDNPPPPPKCSPDIPNDKFGNPILALTGSKVEDVKTNLSAGGIELILNYNSRRNLDVKRFSYPLAFGQTWISNTHRGLRINSETQGVGIDVYRQDGSITTFWKNASGAYISKSNVIDQLVSTSNGYQFIDLTNQAVEEFDANGKLLRLTKLDGTVLSFQYSTAASPVSPASGYLTKISDSNGRTLSFEYLVPAGGVASTDGVVSRVYNDSGQSITTSYDPLQNLSAITWQDGSTTRYLYENASFPFIAPWGLTGIVDENGSRLSTFTYDNNTGLAMATERAGGVSKYSFTYSSPPTPTFRDTTDLATMTTFRSYDWYPPTGTVITAPNGSSSQMESSTTLGFSVPSTVSHPAGSGCGPSASNTVYDTNANVLSRDDFQNNRSCYQYDAKNQKITAIDGLTTTDSCSVVLASGASVPPYARKVSATWHPDWSIPLTQSHAGVLTNYVYNGQPDAASIGGVANCSPAANLPNGKPLPLLCKTVEQALLNANSAVPDPTVAPRIHQFTYDGFGRMLTSTDESGHITSSTYYSDTAFTGTDPNSSGHTMGDLQSVTNASGLVTSFNAYDKAGRLLSMSDPKGVVTGITYTPRGLVQSVTVTPPALSARTTTYTYDLAGQLTGVSSPDGTSVSYTYDAAHRLTGASDARGNSVTYTLDNAGNRIAEQIKDPTGVLQRSITRSFDALNRLQQVTGAVQ